MGGMVLTTTKRVRDAWRLLRSTTDPLPDDGFSTSVSRGADEVLVFDHANRQVIVLSAGMARELARSLPDLASIADPGRRPPAELASS